MRYVVRQVLTAVSGSINMYSRQVQGAKVYASDASPSEAQRATSMTAADAFLHADEGFSPAAGVAPACGAVKLHASVLQAASRARVWHCLHAAKNGVLQALGGNSEARAVHKSTSAASISASLESNSKSSQQLISRVQQAVQAAPRRCGRTHASQHSSQPSSMGTSRRSRRAS